MKEKTLDVIFFTGCNVEKTANTRSFGQNYDVPE
jgi:hypothetical protein